MDGSIGMDSILSQSHYKRAILQRTYRKMTISMSFSYISFVKFHGKQFASHKMTMLFTSVCVIRRYVIKGLYYTIKIILVMGINAKKSLLEILEI